MRTASRLYFTVLVLSFTGISACGDTAALIRKVTYPPDFKYVSGEELRSNMDQLAFQLNLLDQALTDAEPDNTVQQGQVIEILRAIERVSGGLQTGDAGANHPFLQDYMSNFVADVQQARFAASQNPPRYYLAGRIAGSCVNCHQANR